MQALTLKTKLLAIQEGFYKTFVFEDLNREITDEFKYITCVMLPNGSYSYSLEIGDIGYLACSYIDAGKTQGYDSANGRFENYKYDACYFINFIKVKDEIINKEYKF